MSDINSRARGQPSRPHLPMGVVFTGNDIDKLHRHELHRRLIAFFPKFNSKPYRWKKLHSGGWRFQHANAEELLDPEFFNNSGEVFGKDRDFLSHPTLSRV